MQRVNFVNFKEELKKADGGGAEYNLCLPAGGRGVYSAARRSGQLQYEGAGKKAEADTDAGRRAVCMAAAITWRVRLWRRSR